MKNITPYLLDVGLLVPFSAPELSVLDAYIWEVLFGPGGARPYHDPLGDVAASLLYHYWLFLPREGYYALYRDLLTQIGLQRGIQADSLDFHLPVYRLSALRTQLETSGRPDEAALMGLGNLLAIPVLKGLLS